MPYLTQTGFCADPGSLASLQSGFAATGIAMMPGFLAPAVLHSLRSRLDTTQYEIRDEEGQSGNAFGTTWRIPFTDPIIAALCFILNRSSLFEHVSAVSGVPRPKNFVGRIHRTTAGTGQRIDWHNDVADSRILGLNINISNASFEGGAFELRNRQAGVHTDVREWAPGDAFLFQISPGWEHRLTAVTKGARTVAVGWFRSAPEWSDVAKDALRSGVINLLEEHE